MNVSLNEAEVFELLNSYATKIQRQWRMYWFRKCYRFIRLKEAESKEFKLISNYSKYNSERC
jgi:hypothetical protein